MKTITVKIIDPNTIEYPDGKCIETMSSPSTPPPRDGMCWHDAICQWVEPEVMKTQFDYEMPVYDGDEDTENALKEFIG